MSNTFTCHRDYVQQVPFKIAWKLLEEFKTQHFTIIVPPTPLISLVRVIKTTKYLK